jgi:hypothetical protein
MAQINASGNSSSENILQLGSLNDGIRATFRADGNVGIGQSNPTAKLSILNTNATYSLSQNIFNASAGNLWIGQAPAATYLSVDNFALAFCTGSDGGVAGTSVPTNERFRIASNGAWGLAGANYGTSGQVLTSAGSGAAPTWSTAGGGSQWTTTGSDIYYNTGNVGIGNTAPVNRLTVSGPNTASRGQISVVGTSGADARITMFVDSTATGTFFSRSADTSIGSESSSPLRFLTAGSERMRIDAAGKVNLTDTGSIASDTQVTAVLGNTTGNADKLLYLHRPYNQHPGKTSNYYGLYCLQSGADQDGSFTSAAVFGLTESQRGTGVMGKGTTTSVPSYGVVGWVTANTDGYGTGASFFAKYTRTGTATNGGHVGLYIEMPNYYSTADNLNGIYYDSLYTGGNTTYVLRVVRNGSQIGSITTSTTATAYNTSSDYRLKENVVPLAGALERVSKMKPVTYKWKVDQTSGEGFIAHELAEVVPNAVTGIKDETKYEEYVITPEVINMVTVPAELDADGKEITPERQEKIVITPAVMGNRVLPVYQGVDTSFLVATLTAAIQEQQAMIESLKARLDAANL